MVGASNEHSKLRNLAADAVACENWRDARRYYLELNDLGAAFDQKEILLAAHASLKLGFSFEAEGYFRTAIDSGLSRSEEKKALSSLSRLAFARGDWERAIFYLRLSIAIVMRKRDAIMMVSALNKLRQHQEAMQFCDEALRDFPDSVDILTARAQACETGRNWAEAVASWSRVIEFSSSDLAAKVSYATCLRQLGAFSTASTFLGEIESNIRAQYSDKTSEFILQDKRQLSTAHDGVFWITGPSGAGKTTIGNLLRIVGYRTIDGDLELGFYQNRRSGLAAALPPNRPISDQFLMGFRRVWADAYLEKWIQAETCRPLFVYGGPGSKESLKKFDRIFALTVDDDILRERLQHRNKEMYKDGSLRLDMALSMNRDFVEKSRKMGHSVITTGCDPAESALEILETIS